jgi:predicted ribosome quality control (RQC) complex YloA/Tae2 family protein
MKVIKKYIQSLKTDVTYNIGENSQENFDLIDKSHADDIWFHVQGFSSGHVVASIYGLELDKKQLRQIITQGAVICKQQSKYYFMSNLAVLYTRIYNIEKTNVMGTVSTRGAKIKII